MIASRSPAPRVPSADAGPASAFDAEAGLPPPPARQRDPSLVRVGERVACALRLSRDDIRRFAVLTLDRNPVHHDLRAARRAGQVDLIASGQQTSGLLSGLAATHFSRVDDGLARDMLCLNFNYACKAPVPAGCELGLSWVVREVEWNETLGGFIAQLAGEARADGVLAVVARGTVLVRAAREDTGSGDDDDGDAAASDAPPFPPRHA